MSEHEKVVAELRKPAPKFGLEEFDPTYDIRQAAADLIAHQAARLEEVTRLYAGEGRKSLVLQEALTAAEAEKERLLRAATPSPATKAAYIGEFHFDWAVWCPNGEEQITHRVQVPWTTIKQIMATIRARAALSEKEQGDV